MASCSIWACRPIELGDADRGFGFIAGGPLDMRFDPTRGQSAADLCNTLDADELADVIYQYGEEPASRKIARSIVAARPIHSADQLAAVIETSHRAARAHSSGHADVSSAADRGQ